MSVNFTATGAMLNGVRIAGGQHSDASTSTRMIRVVRSGTASGRAEADCERLGFFVNDDPAFPDLNRLFTECVWDADTGRWERNSERIGLLSPPF